jgi:hypothetical protein
MIEMRLKMRKLVGIYERKGVIYVSPYHQTDAGFWVGDEKNIVVEERDTAVLAGAILESLSESKQGVPTPPRDFDSSLTLLKAAGVASFSTFAKSAKSVSVELIEDVIEITPDRNEGVKNGFVPMTDKVIKLPAGHANLATAVLSALDIAE